ESAGDEKVEVDLGPAAFGRGRAGEDRNREQRGGLRDVGAGGEGDHGKGAFGYPPEGRWPARRLGSDSPCSCQRAMVHSRSESRLRYGTTCEPAAAAARARRSARRTSVLASSSD